MHELAITETLVAIAQEQAQGARVLRVTLKLGQLTAILADAIHFCFGPCTTDTPLAGATLDIIPVPGLGRCRHCGAEIPLEVPFGECDCGSYDLEIVQGQDLYLVELELETDPPCV